MVRPKADHTGQFARTIIAGATERGVAAAALCGATADAGGDPEGQADPLARDAQPGGMECSRRVGIRAHDWRPANPTHRVCSLCIMLMFRNDQDFHQACELGIKKVQITYPGGWQKVGLGQVIDGAKAIRSLQGSQR